MSKMEGESGLVLSINKTRYEGKLCEHDIAAYITSCLFHSHSLQLLWYVITKNIKIEYCLKANFAHVILFYKKKIPQNCSKNLNAPKDIENYINVNQQFEVFNQAFKFIILCFHFKILKICLIFKYICTCSCVNVYIRVLMFVFTNPI